MGGPAPLAAMSWVDEGRWGPTGDPDADFPQASMTGDDAKIVRSACRFADLWLNTSQFKVGVGEALIQQLREQQSRQLTDGEKMTLKAASSGCEVLLRDWAELGMRMTK